MEPNQPPDNESGREDSPSADELKRDFVKRFGGYAATAPAALFLLMSPTTSAVAGTDSSP